MASVERPCAQTVRYRADRDIAWPGTAIRSRRTAGRAASGIRLCSSSAPGLAWLRHDNTPPDSRPRHVAPTAEFRGSSLVAPDSGAHPVRLRNYASTLYCRPTALADWHALCFRLRGQCTFTDTGRLGRKSLHEITTAIPFIDAAQMNEVARAMPEEDYRIELVQRKRTPVEVLRTSRGVASWQAIQLLRRSRFW